MRLATPVLGADQDQLHLTPFVQVGQEPSVRGYTHTRQGDHQVGSKVDTSTYGMYHMTRVIVCTDNGVERKYVDILRTVSRGQSRDAVLSIK